MINSDFASNYEIKRYELDSLIRDKYKILSSFEPPRRHPAVIIKYYHNASYSDGTDAAFVPNIMVNHTSVAVKEMVRWRVNVKLLQFLCSKVERLS